MKSFLRLLVVVATMLLLFAPQAMGDNRTRNIKRQQQSNQREMRETKRKLSANASATKRQLSALNRITAEIGEKQSEIAQLSQLTDSLNGQVATLRDSIQFYEKRHSSLSEGYARAVRAVHSHASTLDVMMFLFSSDSFRQAVRRYRYLKQFARWREKQQLEIKEAQRKLVEQRTKLEATLLEKSTALGSLNQANSELLRRQKRQETIVGNLRREAGTLKSLMQQQARQAEELDRRLSELIAEQEREAAARAAREAAEKKAEAKDDKPSTTPSTPPVAEKPTKGYAMDSQERTLSGSFESNKGNLLFPVEGRYRIVKPFGRYKHPELKYVEVENGGIDIEAPSGTKARAVFAGKVSGIFKPDGYNTVVMVRHGNYITVYANLSSITVKPGQEIKTGETIGTIFTDPDADNNAILHFEIRKERDKLNPSLWVK